MAKKILALCAALVAFAALPAVASATNSPELVQGGTAVATGTNIQATNVGKTVMKDGSGNPVLECEAASMTGTVNKNDGSNVEGTISASSFTSCSGSFGSNVTVTTNPATNGLNWCIRSTSTMATHEFQVRGNSCGSLARAIRFILHTAFGECVYQRTAALPGKYTTGVGSTELSISEVEFEKLSGGFQCSTIGKLSMTFTLESDDGKQSRIDII